MGIVKYSKESYDELINKVSWPTWNELQNSAIVVSIASLIIALVVFLMDISFRNVLDAFYKLLN
ncbi:MAG: preprotein translocase subunit SecE [Bacteroidales bacterium]|nr:preprotein translocase subunit SecE [Bacteroidales bacterium]RLD39612.1 MAG: preprotein translocase subunit SecE [Bacteroidota bacterium]